jgi:hypothetical protein
MVSARDCPVTATMPSRNASIGPCPCPSVESRWSRTPLPHHRCCLLCVRGPPQHSAPQRDKVRRAVIHAGCTPLASPSQAQRMVSRSEYLCIALWERSSASVADRARIGWKRAVVRTVVPACRTSQEHQLPLSTCHVRSDPWTTWSTTGPDCTVAPPPWRPASRQPRAGTPTTPPCQANQAAASTGVGWPPRSDTRDSANADPLAQAGLAVAAVTGTAGPAGTAAG